MQRGWHYQGNRKYKIGAMRNDYHWHDPSPEREELRLAALELRERARSENPMGTSEAIEIVRRHMPVELRALDTCPSSSAQARTYQSHRRKAEASAIDRGLDVRDPLNIVIPNEWMPNVILNEVVLHQHQQKRIIAFSTPFQRDLMNEHIEDFCMDGTFQVIETMIQF